jgi:GNT-I family
VPENVVTFTVSSQRQRYFRAALDSWSRCRGVSDWHLVFCLEPCRNSFPLADFTRWTRDTFASSEVVVNDTRLGCSKNTRAALTRAFAGGARFAVLAEEDITVSSDVLEYFSWARGEYEADPDVLAVCAHAKESSEQDSSLVMRVPWFSPLVWGTWPDRWRSFINPRWNGFDGNWEAWDTNLRVHLQQENRVSIFPARSRSLHIGELSTLTPGPLAEYLYGLSKSECFTSDYPAQKYREAQFEQVPGMLV